MEWYRSICSVLETVEKKGFILYGAGFWGEVAVNLFQKFDMKPLAVCDDDMEKRGREFCGTVVEPIESACEKYPESVVIVAAADYGLDSDRGKMNQKLRNLGRYTKETGFNIIRYSYLLDCEWDSLNERSENRFLMEDVDGLIILNHMSDSGCIYFNNLIDGHSRILNVPLLGHYTELRMAYDKRLRYLRGIELVFEIMGQLFSFLKTSIKDSDFPEFERLAVEYCLDENGESEERVYLDPQKMMQCLYSIERTIDLGEEISFGQLLKMIFVAYNNAIGKKKESGVKYWIFYQMHTPDFHLQELNRYCLEGDFSKIECLYIIREPVQQTFSWMNRFVMRGDERERRIMSDSKEVGVRFRSAIGNMLEVDPEVRVPVHVVRFEDLKLRSRETMEKICNYLGIEYEEILAQTTANGIKVYFPFYNIDGSVTYITGNTTNAVKKKDVSGAMTVFDEFRLELVYADMKQAYNYFDEAVDYIKIRKEIREEIFDYDFKFYSIFEQYNGEIESLKEMLQKDFKRRLKEESVKKFYPLI